MYDNQNNYNPYAQNIAIVKDYFKKPLVLVTGIFYIFNVLFSLIYAVVGGSKLGDMYAMMFSSPEFTSGMTVSELEMIRTFTDSPFMSLLVTAFMVPSIITVVLFALAYFLIYFKSKNPDPNATPKAGVMILFVMSIISLVGTIFATLIFALYAVLFIILGVFSTSSQYMSSEDTTIMMIICIVFAVIMIGAAAIMLIYSISNMNYHNSIRKSLSDVELTCKGAGLYGVFSIISGIFSIFSAILTIAYGPLMNLTLNMIPAGEIDYMTQSIVSSFSSVYTLAGIMALVSSVISILVGALAVGYKKHIKNVKNSYIGEQVMEEPFYNPPVYSQPQYTQSYQPEPVVSDDSATKNTCPSCGNTCSDDDMFCNNCGTRIK